jgi:hypothetical protein
MNRKVVIGLLGLVVFPLTSANAAVTFFSSRDAFRSAASSRGKVLKGTEDFEEGRIGVGAILGMNDPLDRTTNNAIFQPGEIEDNVRFQSNIGGANDAQPAPHGTNGLAVANNVLGYPSKWIVSNYFVDSHDIIFYVPSDNHTAVGGNLISVAGAGPVRIRVYDKQNQLQGEGTIQAAPPGSFAGVLSDSTIGRINLFSTTNQAEGLDNVEMWAVPEPATFSLLGLAALALRRRR